MAAVITEMVHDVVLSPKNAQRGYFKNGMFEEILRRHNRDEASFYGTAIWNVLMLELWLRR